MESTLTRNSALYFAQHKVSRARRELFRKFRVTLRAQKPASQRQLNLPALALSACRHIDNGR